MGLIRIILNLYVYVIIIDTILSYIPNPSIVNSAPAQFIRKIADFTLKPVRKMLSSDLPVDISPAVVIIVIYVIKAVW